MVVNLSKEEESSSGRSRPKFGLANLLLVLMSVGLFMGWVTESFRHRQIMMRQNEEHRAEVARLNAQHSSEKLELIRENAKLRRADSIDVVRELQVLSFHKESITDDQIRFLARFPELRKLDLSGAKITPQQLELISKLGQLESLNLAHNPELTDESLSCLQGMPRLRELELTACAGLSIQGLMSLTAIPTLERVRLDPRHRPVAAKIVRALPKCLIVFENVNKLESFGILATFAETREKQVGSVWSKQSRSPKEENRLRFGTIRGPRVRVVGLPVPAGDETKAVPTPSDFSKKLRAFMENPHEKTALKRLLDIQEQAANDMLPTLNQRERAFYLLTRLNADRTNPRLATELYELPFSVVRAVANSTFWPNLLPSSSGGKAYFEAYEKINGTTAVNVISLMATNHESKIDGLCLIEERIFILESKPPAYEWAKVLYGDIGRHLFKKNYVQRFDSRGCAIAAPSGMQLRSVKLTTKQVEEWIQNSNPTPAWSIDYLPDLPKQQ